MADRAETPRTAEHVRLAEATGRAEDDLYTANPWYEWGPYLSERAWGTVREDYSANGEAWDYFPHDHARSRAYRWNEDGMAGLSDIHHDLCLALALWNGEDPILKERMFGLTGPQGNHGEDVKEYWWYLEGLPSHALLRWRYHYPQREFPYEQLVVENGRRGKLDPEFELLETGVFDDDRYWSIDVTYAKASPTEILARIEVCNHGPDEAELHVLPTLWFTNTWRWEKLPERPRIERDGSTLRVADHRLAGYRLEGAPGPDETPPDALFCENETNTARIFGTEPLTPYPKDGISEHVVHGAETVNPDEVGTKAALWYRLSVPGGGTAELRLRLADAGTKERKKWSGAAFDKVVARREREADEFYAALAPDGVDEERMRVLRQACAGLVWSKQIYPYDVRSWLDGDPGEPPPPASRKHGRNATWRHVDTFDVLAMPDPWEYPWFAAWDLAFHAVPWAHLDPAFAKYQLVVLLREWFKHPNGALPSYEWSFDDVNPPVHAMAAMRVFMIDGARDRAFLERVFPKLLVNYTWWLNRQDPDGNNVFGGGFLGLDNISPIDRSHLPPGYRLEEADGTAWMAYYALTMLVMALVLAEENYVYDDMVITFVEQFALIVRALDEQGLFDPEDGFFYDRLVNDAGEDGQVRVQTVAGLIPLLPGVALPARALEAATRLGKRFARVRERWQESGGGMLGRVRVSGDEQRVLVSVIGPDRLARTLAPFFDEAGFLSPHGVRSVSKRYDGNPYTLPGLPGATIDYEPAESTTDMYGGNSNWRGPVWFPVNYLLIRSLVNFHRFYADELTLEYPTGSGEHRTLLEIARDLADRLVAIWLPGPDGRRPVYGGTARLQEDPAWKDNLLFFEHFHGDNGAGLGAMHQTGWTALVADLILDPP
jgi:Mannosylglycerate hydrolase MGH1-like glycoside hydrolase domain